MKKILREPLLHFLAAGLLLFGVYRWVHGPLPAAEAGPSKDIVVDRKALLTFLQYQANAFQPKYFGGQFDAMSAKARQDLIDKYVREEALYREAEALGLAQGDYVIRRRMVQKMLYLIEDTATESFAPTDAEIERYFRAHRRRYEVAPSLTFTHVFVDAEIQRREGPEKAAERLKRELEAQHATFADAPKYGDRFPYLQNYVNMTPDYVRNQFGEAFAAAVMKLEPSDHAWRGPIKSLFGYHLVMLTAHTPAHVPELTEIRDEVRDDMLRDRVAAYREKAVKDLTRRMNVKLDASLAADPQRTAAAQSAPTTTAAR